MSGHNNEVAASAKNNRPSSQNLSTLRIPLEKDSRVPWKIRQASLEKIYAEVGITSRALAIESDIYDGSKTKQAYMSTYASRILVLRRGTEELPSGLSREAIPVEKLRAMVHEQNLLVQQGYILSAECVEKLSIMKGIQNGSFLCDRCKSSFTPVAYYDQDPRVREGCLYHFGPKIKSLNQRLHSCCHRRVGEIGCTQADAHVYSMIPAIDRFESIASWPVLDSQLPVVALDAEMIYTDHGLFPARISMIDWHSSVALDTLVRSPFNVVDYNTRYSGISADQFDNSCNNSQVIDSPDLLGVLKHFIGPTTIIIGHSLENDLLALKVITDQVIDTSILFPHPSRLDAKQSLKNLSREYLKEFIQEGSEGHSSIQDAIACLKLVKLKVNEF